MPSFLGLDTNFGHTNLSILAIPAYYVISVLPHSYAISVATQGQVSKWDNRNPRSSDLKAKLKERLPRKTFAKYERLEACHANGMENLPLFAAAVVLGNMAGLKKTGWDGLNSFAGIFLAIRLAYTGVYVTHQTQGPTLVRSGLWAAGVALCFRTIIRAAGAMSGPGEAATGFLRGVMRY